MSIPAGAQCYICLGEDDENELVWDCSCRGDSAGFAHQSCIVQYAEQKSKEVTV
jgi:E3 ubiquitin-protein ligase DOA10